MNAQYKATEIKLKNVIQLTKVTIIRGGGSLIGNEGGLIGNEAGLLGEEEGVLGM